MLTLQHLIRYNLSRTGLQARERTENVIAAHWLFAGDLRRSRKIMGITSPLVYATVKGSQLRYGFMEAS
jgi:hypothetical protein